MYFSVRGKEDACDDAATVTAALPADMQGLTTDRNPENPFAMVFKSMKHVVAMLSYLQATAADHHNVRISISVDDSHFLAV